MSRVIKFRAWDKERKIMWHMMPTEEGYFFIDNFEDPSYISGHCYEIGLVLAEADRFIVLQYTGLKDKNDKEICEGDILQWNEGQIGKVYWCEKSACFYVGANPEIEGFLIHELDSVIISSVYKEFY